MGIGECRLFEKDRMPGVGAQIRSIASRLGCRVKTQKLILVDPDSGEAQIVVLVEKLSECAPTKKRGRKGISKP